MSAVPPRVDFADAFPASTKVYVTGECAGERVCVPVREIALSGGEAALQVYDTSGPQGCDVRQGLPPIRAEWIVHRGQGIETPSPSYRPVPGGTAAPEIPASLRRRVLRG